MAEIAPKTVATEVTPEAFQAQVDAFIESSIAFSYISRQLQAHREKVRSWFPGIVDSQEYEEYQKKYAEPPMDYAEELAASILLVALSRRQAGQPEQVMQSVQFDSGVQASQDLLETTSFSVTRQVVGAQIGTNFVRSMTSITPVF